MARKDRPIRLSIEDSEVQELFVGQFDVLAELRPYAVAVAFGANNRCVDLTLQLTVPMAQPVRRRDGAV